MLVKINKIVLLFSFLFSLTFFSLINVRSVLAKDITTCEWEEEFTYYNEEIGEELFTPACSPVSPDSKCIKEKPEDYTTDEGSYKNVCCCRTVTVKDPPVEAASTEGVFFSPQVTIPGSDFKQETPNTIEGSTATIGKYIRSVYNYLLAIVGLVAAIVLMLGGVIWLTAAGNSEKIGQAKNLIGGSLTGLVLALSSFLILKTINPFLVDFQNEDIVKIDTVLSCCNPTEGLKSGALDKNNKYVCPTGSTVCQEKEECTKLSGKETWQCLSEQTIAQTYRCCEYIDTLGYLTCVDEKKELTCPKIEGKEWRAVYEQVLCDPDGSGRTDSLALGWGGKCHYPGPKQCCQCRWSRSAFSLVMWNSDCIDNVPEGYCSYWCSKATTIGREIYRSLGGANVCNSNGYCRVPGE